MGGSIDKLFTKCGGINKNDKKVKQMLYLLNKKESNLPYILGFLKRRGNYGSIKRSNNS